MALLPGCVEFGMKHIQAMRDHLGAWIGTDMPKRWAYESNPSGGSPCLIVHAGNVAGRFGWDDAYGRFCLDVRDALGNPMIYRCLEMRGPERVLAFLDEYLAKHDPAPVEAVVESPKVEEEELVCV